MHMVKVTKKRRITLPKEICDKLGIAPGDILRVYVTEDGKAVIEKAISLNDLAGSLNPGRTLSNLAEELDKERKQR